MKVATGEVFDRLEISLSSEDRSRWLALMAPKEMQTIYIEAKGYAAHDPGTSETFHSAPPLVGINRN